MNENLDKHQVGNFDLVNELAKQGHKQIEIKDESGTPDYEVGNNHLANLHAGYDAVATREALNLTHHPVETQEPIELAINNVECKILWMQGERTAIEVPTHLAQKFLDEWNAILKTYKLDEVYQEHEIENDNLEPEIIVQDENISDDLPWAPESHVNNEQSQEEL